MEQCFIWVGTGKSIEFFEVILVSHSDIRKEVEDNGIDSVRTLARNFYVDHLVKLSSNTEVVVPLKYLTKSIRETSRAGDFIPDEVERG